MERIDRKFSQGPKVCIIAYNNLCAFEFGIATEVFGLPRPELGKDWYHCEILSAEGPILETFEGVRLQVDNDLSALQGADIIVLPGWREPYINVPQRLLEVLVEAYHSGARIVAICGGAYVLAATGLLSGKKATTHWRFLHHFVNAFPEVELEDAPLFCEEERLYTSAGSAAGIDLCLHIVQQDFGIEKANSVAKRLVVSPLRAGHQSQKSAQAILPQNKHHRLQKVLEDLGSDLAAHPTLEMAAKRANLEPRTFMRHFERITGTTFSKWLKAQRLERARTLLRETDLSIELIAEACGYASSSSLRRIFQSDSGQSPRAFRKAVTGNATQ